MPGCCFRAFSASCQISLYTETEFHQQNASFYLTSFKGKFETSGGVRPQKYGAVALETVSVDGMCCDDVLLAAWAPCLLYECALGLMSRRCCLLPAALPPWLPRPWRATRAIHPSTQLHPTHPPSVPQTMFSEAVNQPTFPSEILRPGEQYSNRVVWRFTQSPPSALASALRESPAASAAAAAHGVSRLAAVLTLATAGLLAAWM